MFLTRVSYIICQVYPNICKKCIEFIGCLVISVLFTLINVGKLFLLPFLEMISLIVFHVFLISDLYLAKVDARNCCLAAHMLIFNILCLKVNIYYFITLLRWDLLISFFCIDCLGILLSLVVLLLSM